MADLIFVVIVVAFFAITVAYVRACDHIIGPDLDLTSSSAADVAAAAPGGPDRPGAVTAGGRPASAEVETATGAW